MFYVTLNKRNPVTFPNTPQHARAHYCSTERHTRSFSKTLLALVAADTQGHAASCTNQVLASTLHQRFGFVSTPSFFAVHYLERDCVMYLYITYRNVSLHEKNACAFSMHHAVKWASYHAFSQRVHAGCQFSPTSSWCGRSLIS